MTDLCVLETRALVKSESGASGGERDRERKPFLWKNTASLFFRRTLSHSLAHTLIYPHTHTAHNPTHTHLFVILASTHTHSHAHTLPPSLWHAYSQSRTKLLSVFLPPSFLVTLSLSKSLEHSSTLSLSLEHSNTLSLALLWWVCFYDITPSPTSKPWQLLHDRTLKNEQELEHLKVFPCFNSTCAIHLKVQTGRKGGSLLERGRART